MAAWLAAISGRCISPVPTAWRDCRPITHSARAISAHTFSVTLKTTGTQTVTATDTVTGSLTVTTPNITVSAAAASVFSISAPATSTAGAAFNATVTAKDAFGNTATGYTGTVHFTSTDGQAVLPANYTFVAGDNGSHQVSADAQDRRQSNRHRDRYEHVLDHRQFDHDLGRWRGRERLHGLRPCECNHGRRLHRHRDGQGRLRQRRRPATPARSTSPRATARRSCPPNYTFVAGDNGVHQFSVTMNTTGPQSVTATDTVTGSITGNTNTTVTSANPATHFSVSAPVERDGRLLVQHHRHRPGRRQRHRRAATSARCISRAPTAQAVLPANYTFTGADNGAHTFTVTLETGGNQTITATDTVTGSITGTRGRSPSTPATATHSPSPSRPTSTAGTAFNVTVTAKDAFGNIATGYTGTVHFTSRRRPGDPARRTTPSPPATTARTPSRVTLKTSGSQTITATDTVTSAITGNNSTTVAAAAASVFSLTAPAGAEWARPSM